MIAGNSMGSGRQVSSRIHVVSLKITSDRADTFLGMQIKQLDDGSVFIHQSGYINEC